MNVPIIKMSLVSKSFGEQLVLKDVNMEVKEGDVVGLLGPNGSGKTTMIRLMNGVILPTNGTIQVGGHSPYEGEEVRQMSGILTENAGLYHEMSGIDNLSFFAKLYGHYDQKQIERFLDEFQLSEHKDKKVGTYSTGMKRRLGIIKAILHNPKILFLDEPTNGLDPEGIKLVLKFVEDLNKREGTTIFLCSHILHQLEDACKNFMFLHNGRIVDSGSLQQLQEKYISEIQLKVETNLDPKGGIWEGYKVWKTGENVLTFTLASKDHITPLLDKLIQRAWIHHVEIENRDLESIYFKIRGEKNE